MKMIVNKGQQQLLRILNTNLQIMTVAFFSQRSLLPFIERKIAGKTIKILIDTGSSKNYIQPLTELKYITPVQKTRITSIFMIRSI